MFISIVVPLFNAEPYLRQSLDALLAQDYPREAYEVVVVDNNSTDGSQARVRQNAGVRLVHAPRQGAYAARNRGIEAARGPVVAFTDPDCIPRSDWLAQIARALDDARVGVTLGYRRAARPTFMLSMIEDYENAKDQYVLGSSIPDIYYGYTNNMAVRRSVLDKIGRFRDDLPRGADTIFVRQVVDRLSPGAVTYNPDMVVTHLELRSSLAYYRKLCGYGRHRGVNNSAAMYTRPLSRRERLDVFRATVRARRYSWPKATLCLGLLFGGWVAWTFGYVSSRSPSQRVGARGHTQG